MRDTTIKRLWPRCDFCQKELSNYPLIMAIGVWGDSTNSYTPKYCPICGRPLVPSAWKELKETLEKLYETEKACDPDIKNQNKVKLNLLEQVLHDIQHIPAFDPLNEPLTYAQLKEMNGEAVWVEDVKHWALIDIEKGGQWDGVPFAVWEENGAKFCYNILDRNLLCYRRPPEGEDNETK